MYFGVGQMATDVQIKPPTLPKELTQLNLVESESIEKIDNEFNNNEDEDIIEDQEFIEHVDAVDRYRKSFYYGGYSNADMPQSDRFSMSLTELCVEAFTKAKISAPSNSCESILDPSPIIYRQEDDSLDRIDVYTASRISRKICATPTSLMLALFYLNRLRHNNRSYLQKITSTDLFLISLMVASKYLHDDGEEDEVIGQEWADVAGISLSHLNDLELEYLDALDWSLYISPNEFETVTNKVETAIARKKVAHRGWMTYTDLKVLTENLNLLKIFESLVEYVIKATAICATAYAASILTMLGTMFMLNKAMVAITTPTNSIVKTIDQANNYPMTSETSPTNSPADDSTVQDLNMTSNASLILESLSELSNKTQNELMLDQLSKKKILNGIKDNPTSPLVNSIENHLIRKKDREGGTTDNNDPVDEDPLNHHSTSVLLWPNQTFIQKSINLLQLYFGSPNHASSIPSDLSNKQCPLSKLSIFAGMTGIHLS